MFVSKCDRIFWRVFRVMWSIAPNWRYRLKLLLIFTKALYQQEEFIFGPDGDFPTD